MRNGSDCREEGLTRPMPMAQQEKMADMEFKDLTPELKEKLAACKTPEDVLKLAKEEGYEISDDELEAISGGTSWRDVADGLSGCTLLGH